MFFIGKNSSEIANPRGLRALLGCVWEREGDLQAKRLRSSLGSKGVFIVEFLERVTEQRGDEGINIDFPFEINDVLIEADKRRLARVLSNLLDNADHYAGGATRIEVQVNEDTLILSVIDDGPGISREDQSSIFERFARGTEGSRRGSSTGTGLGLSLVAEHVKLHGGSVEVWSANADGSGSIFTITLPGVIR